MYIKHIGDDDDAPTYMLNGWRSSVKDIWWGFGWGWDGRCGRALKLHSRFVCPGWLSRIRVCCCVQSIFIQVDGSPSVSSDGNLDNGNDEWIYNYSLTKKWQQQWIASTTCGASGWVHLFNQLKCFDTPLLLLLFIKNVNIQSICKNKV